MKTKFLKWFALTIILGVVFGLVLPTLFSAKSGIAVAIGFAIIMFLVILAGFKVVDLYEAAKKNGDL